MLHTGGDIGPCGELTDAAPRVRGHRNSDSGLSVSLPSGLSAQSFTGLLPLVYLSLLRAVAPWPTMESPAQHDSSPPPLFYFFILFYTLGFTFTLPGGFSECDTGTYSINITWNLLEIPVAGLQPKPAKTEALGWACILPSLQVFWCVGKSGDHEARSLFPLPFYPSLASHCFLSHSLAPPLWTMIPTFPSRLLLLGLGNITEHLPGPRLRAPKCIRHTIQKLSLVRAQCVIQLFQRSVLAFSVEVSGGSGGVRKESSPRRQGSLLLYVLL